MHRCEWIKYTKLIIQNVRKQKGIEWISYRKLKWKTRVSYIYYECNKTGCNNNRSKRTKAENLHHFVWMLVCVVSCAAVMLFLFLTEYEWRRSFRLKFSSDFNELQYMYEKCFHWKFLEAKCRLLKLILMKFKRKYVINGINR